MSNRWASDILKEYIMKADAVLFDLDGTLLNTLHGIATAANAVLAEHDFPTHDIEEYNIFVGDGLRKLIERILPPNSSEDTIDICVEMFNKEYAARCYDGTVPYDGIMTMLDELVELDIPVGILSNKPHAFACEMVEYYFSHIPFAYVAGQQEGVAPKPDSEGVTLALEALNVMAENVLFVGDTSVDMETAENSDMVAAGVSWGFRPVEELLSYGAKIIIERPQEIVDYVTS